MTFDTLWEQPPQRELTEDDFTRNRGAFMSYVNELRNSIYQRRLDQDAAVAQAADQAHLLDVDDTVSIHGYGYEPPPASTRPAKSALKSSASGGTTPSPPRKTRAADSLAARADLRKLSAEVKKDEGLLVPLQTVMHNLRHVHEVQEDAGDPHASTFNRQLTAVAGDRKLREYLDYERQKLEAKTAETVANIHRTLTNGRAYLDDYLQYTPADPAPSNNARDEYVKAAQKRGRISEAGQALAGLLTDLCLDHNEEFSYKQFKHIVVSCCTPEFGSTIATIFRQKKSLNDAISHLLRNYCKEDTVDVAASKLLNFKISYKTLLTDLSNFYLAYCRLQMRMKEDFDDRKIIDAVVHRLPEKLQRYAVAELFKLDKLKKISPNYPGLSWEEFCDKLQVYAQEEGLASSDNKVKAVEAAEDPHDVEETIHHEEFSNSSRSETGFNSSSTASGHFALVQSLEKVDPAAMIKQIQQGFDQKMQSFADQQKQMQQDMNNKLVNMQLQATTAALQANNQPPAPPPMYYPPTQSSPTIHNYLYPESESGRSTTSSGFGSGKSTTTQPGGSNNGSQPYKAVFTERGSAEEAKAAAALFKDQNREEVFQQGFKKALEKRPNGIGKGRVHALPADKKSEHTYNAEGRIIPRSKPFQGHMFIKGKNKDQLTYAALNHYSTHCVNCGENHCSSVTKSCPYYNSPQAWGPCSCGHGFHQPEACKTAKN